MSKFGPKGLDWPALMQAGLFGLRLRPAEFWSLTPIELSIMLGAEAKSKPLTRHRLEELAAAFPDVKKESGDEQNGRFARASRDT